MRKTENGYVLTEADIENLFQYAFNKGAESFLDIQNIRAGKCQIGSTDVLSKNEKNIFEEIQTLGKSLGKTYTLVLSFKENEKT